jgi:hypothetical protein
MRETILAARDALDAEAGVAADSEAERIGREWH